MDNYSMHVNHRIFLTLLLTTGALCLGAGDSATVTVVASAETHAMLFPCDCPVEPGGGFAERATVLKKIGAPDALLLLDAGGFSGGGIYDEYTGGRQADSLRTLAAIHAMGKMRYDAAAIGDDELQYGGRWLARAADSARLPLVSANCTLKSGRTFVPRYLIVSKKGVRFGITAVTPPERLFAIDDSCVVTPPVSGLRKIWKELKAASDFQVILSHLGEEETRKLADSFPDASIIVNGHRKVSQFRAQLFGKTLVMQFGYQGKKLSLARLRLSKAGRTFQVEADDWAAVAPPAPPDSGVAALLQPKQPAAARPVYDLYIMSQCSFGCTALAEFVRFVETFPDVEWQVWFIGTAIGDSLSSLHGPDEIRDEMRWLAVQALFPGKWLAFLRARGMPGATTAAVFSSMAIDGTAVERWTHDRGRQALADHYRRSARLGITASPTLYVSNGLFEKNIERRRLVKAHCLTLAKNVPVCDSLPECLDDSDCRRKGAVGACSAAGTCSFTPDAAFTFTALIADSTLQHPEKTVLATTGELFPNAVVEIVTSGSQKGRQLLRSWSVPALPFYFFGRGAGQAHNFSRVESGLVAHKDGFTFKNGVTPRNYFPLRQRSAGSVTLFCDPLFPEAGEAFAALAGEALIRPRLRVVPVIYADPVLPPPSVEEKVRREEALRWLALDSLYRGAYFGYLGAMLKDQGSTYWFRNLSRCGIEQAAFVRQVEAGEGMLQALWRELGDCGVRSPVSLLLENRETAIVRNAADLAEILAALKKRAVQKP